MAAVNEMVENLTRLCTLHFEPRLEDLCSSACCQVTFDQAKHDFEAGYSASLLVQRFYFFTEKHRVHQRKWISS
jgi:hypothetical protein